MEVTGLVKPSLHPLVPRVKVSEETHVYKGFISSVGSDGQVSVNIPSTHREVGLLFVSKPKKNHI